MARLCARCPPAGRHDIGMAVQRVGGTAETIQAFYTNLQAIVFAK